jgi:hypothetical protein
LVFFFFFAYLGDVIGGDSEVTGSRDEDRSWHRLNLWEAMATIPSSKQTSRKGKGTNPKAP